ncbi:long-chain fatty acid--CoA ligase [Bifidobacterium longum subsp. infantis]|uniref:Acyl-CoA synthetase n=1 Tax=Bifidobacterium longum subsp. infantis TaxID=1682 RepID=A0A7D4XVX9_BIFLI|nr:MULTISPECIES: AMP-dependent synthetase/ligase [Bifidobacterium]KEY28082.1 AMP-binding protein [Bifidobacterium longum subsp. infantis EK3]NQX50116.1 long-chain fatty acid--CoA ligase [Bifidobacterium longum subsp. infantis]QKY12964.1 long-chain fatty acid--CoA ligase [Bifidobacterium longum subsp. infantis]UPT03083.1 long-chain fatty acid--CoA ligase [Bifidobacterium longum subsp. infantis]UPT05627.1 long-chain fatty acid--CoA ligase [Bifidobacterium longum subsp. infantis]
MTENIADKAINDTRIVKQFTNPVKEPIDSDVNLFDLLDNRAKRDPEGAMIEYKGDDGTWHPYSAQVFRDMVIDLAKGLIGLGVNKGDSVAIVSRTRWEWTALDVAIMSIGAVTVPVYETNSASQVSWIFNDSKVTLAIAEDDGQRDKIESVRSEVPTLRNVFVIEAGGLNAIKTYGESITDAEFWEYKEASHGDDRATIVYTSGSTGTPKGVELTHRNFAFLVFSALQYMPRAGAWPNRRLLLFLPLSHVFARFMEFFSFGGTISLALSSNMKTMVKDFETFGPTLLLAVPRVYEKVYNAASQRAGTGFAGKMFMRAAENAREWSKAEQKGEQLPIAGRIAHAFYEQVVYKKIRTIFGPNADFAITGGAPMDSELSHFFNGIGMPVLEGYGMTETCGPVCVSLPEDNRIGTIGMPMCGITAGIAEDGELVVKGPLVCKGYHNNPEVTTQQITDGWLHTGDLGDISEDGFISITGRKKDLIITAGGKNVSPGLLEASVMTSPVVNQCLVIGDKKPFVAALVTLDLADANNWLESQGAKPEPDLASLAKNAIVHAEVERAVNAANEGVSRAESIRKFEILPDEFTEANGMLTPSLKTRRAQIVKHYQELIDNVIYVPLKK